METIDNMDTTDITQPPVRQVTTDATDYLDIIRQSDIDDITPQAVMVNSAISSDGVAMIGDIYLEINGEFTVLRITFDVLPGEDPEEQEIYTVGRIIDIEKRDIE